MLSKYEALEYAHQTGQFWRAETGIRQSDLHKLTGDEPEARAAIASFYEMHAAQVDEGCRLFHGRAARLESSRNFELGPATQTTMAAYADPFNRFLVRCPIPDAAPPVGEVFSYSDPDIQAAVESYQWRSGEAGGGYWPKGCWERLDPRYKDHHVLVIAVNESRMPEHTRDDWWSWHVPNHQKECAKLGLLVLYFRDDEHAQRTTDTESGGKPIRTISEATNGKRDIDFRWESFGPHIGIAQFPSKGCSAQVWCKMSTRYNGDTNQISTLNFHENGHNLHFEHTPRGIMMPTLGRVPIQWVGDYREPQFRDQFGGEDVSHLLDDTTPPPPTGKLTLPLTGAWHTPGYLGIALVDGRAVAIEIADGQLREM